MASKQPKKKKSPDEGPVVEIETTPVVEKPSTTDLAVTGDTSNSLSKRDEADKIIDKHVKLSIGAGIIPIPVVDIVTIFSSHYILLKELAKLYDVPVTEEKGKQVVTSLLGAVGAPFLGHGIVGSLIKGIPGFGSVAGAVTVSALSGASAYSIGSVLSEHFENGGTLQDFEPKKIGTFYKAKFDEGMEIASKLNKDFSSTASTSGFRVSPSR